MAESPVEEHLNIASQSDVSVEDSEGVQKTMDAMLDAVVEGKVFEKDSTEISPTGISSFVEMEDSPIFKENDIYESVESLSKQTISKPTRRSRSISENESESNANPQSIGRRKFGSEGAIFSACKSAFPPVKRRELDEAVEQYIEKLIKESIYKAVRSVNVENLCEGILKKISSRQNSIAEEPENDFIVEQRLHSDSITELIELEKDFSSTRESTVEVNGELPIRDDVKDNAKESFENEIDDSDQASFRGYLADLDDTASVEDLKSAEESLNSSISSTLDHKVISLTTSNEITENFYQNVDEIECTQTLEVKSTSKDKVVSAEITDGTARGNRGSLSNECPRAVNQNQPIKLESPDLTHPLKGKETSDVVKQPKLETESESQDTLCEQEEKSLLANPPDEILPSPKEEEGNSQKSASSENIDGTVHLIKISSSENLLSKTDSKTEENQIPAVNQTSNPPQFNEPSEDQTKVNWKVGYLHVKLPHKARGKTHLKAWRKRRVIIQPDEFVNDPKNPSLVISVYGSDSKKHETTFWHSVSGQKAVVFRSSSRTHRYAFTISEGGQPLIHLASDRETASQEWMAAIRAVLWPPSPFMELEKMLNGREFEVSIIDNEYSYHAGLLGMYGYLSITPKKLILLHPQQGYVIQEWYLNTVDKFQFVPQPKPEDDHKVLCMTTCKDSSTGKGDLIIFCNESVTLLQSLASNIHEVLSLRSKEEGGRYRKELEEIAEWLVAPPQDCLNVDSTTDEHYKVPPRQVKSLLDIPNFIFNQSLSPVASAVYPAPSSNIMEPLDGAAKSRPVTTSNDSGISTCTSGEDFLNCSMASFIIGGGPLTGKSSDSELSDAYTPPRTPEVRKKKNRCDVLKEEHVATG